MARPIDEFALAWASLAGDGDGIGWRTIPIAPAGACALAAGRRFPGNEEALLVGFTSARLMAGESLPEGQGFDVVRVDHQGDGLAWLALNRRQSGSIELFAAMTRDICAALDSEAGSTEERLLRVFLGRVHAWQEFMRKGGQALSSEAEVGLVGELFFLRAMVEAGIAPGVAVGSWLGPLDGVQDFELGTGAVEVKATLSTAGFPARIGSLEQLDDSIRQPLFVAGERLSQRESGLRLPDLIAAIRTLVESDPEGRRLFAERSMRAGYYDAHAERYVRRFQRVDPRLLAVDDKFPRLTHGRVPRGVLQARYVVDLDAVSSGSVPLKEALRMLGVD